MAYYLTGLPLSLPNNRQLCGLQLTAAPASPFTVLGCHILQIDSLSIRHYLPLSSALYKTTHTPSLCDALSVSLTLLHTHYLSNCVQGTSQIGHLIFEDLTLAHSTFSVTIRKSPSPQ